MYSSLSAIWSTLNPDAFASWTELCDAPITTTATTAPTTTTNANTNQSYAFASWTEFSESEDLQGCLNNNVASAVKDINLEHELGMSFMELPPGRSIAINENGDDFSMEDHTLN